MYGLGLKFKVVLPLNTNIQMKNWDRHKYSHIRCSALQYQDVIVSDVMYATNGIAATFKKNDVTFYGTMCWGTLVGCDRDALYSSPKLSKTIVYYGCGDVQVKFQSILHQ